jgi:site-specific recombinase XerC
MRECLVDTVVGLDRVAELLGHESLGTTRIYTTPIKQDLQRDVEKTVVQVGDAARSARRVLACPASWSIYGGRGFRSGFA